MIDRIDASELAHRFGTPIYVGCAERMKENIGHMKEVFQDYYSNVEIAFSYKTNYLPAVCSIFHREGAFAEVTSLLELSIAERLKVDPSCIVFNGPAKSDEELLYAMKMKIYAIFIDSLTELRRLIRLTKKFDLDANVGIRLRSPETDPERWTKFGLDIQRGEALQACRIISKNSALRFVGIHGHLGTQITQVARYGRLIEMMTRFADEVYRDCRLRTEVLDIGGGFPDPGLRPIYKASVKWPPPPIEDYAEAVGKKVRGWMRGESVEDTLLLLEPGRFLIGDTFFLLVRVVSVKKTSEVARWIIVDGGTNLLPSAPHYYHDILPHIIRRGKVKKTDIGGPLCMQSDYIGLQRPLPPLQDGDILVVCNAGAYTVSFSQAFTKPRAGAVIVDGDDVRLVRRHETVEDILSLYIF